MASSEHRQVDHPGPFPPEEAAPPATAPEGPDRHCAHALSAVARLATAARGYAGSALVVAGTTGLAWEAARHLHVPDVEMLFLLGVAVAAVRFGRGPSLLAAAASVAAYDLFFVPPILSLKVANARYFLSFAMMFAISVGLSSMTLRLRRQGREARLREARTASLYALTRELASAVDSAAAARIGARHGAEALGAPVAVLLLERSGQLASRAVWPEGGLTQTDLDAAREVLDAGAPDHRAGQSSWTVHVALRTGSTPLGVLSVAWRGLPPPSAEQRRFLDALGRQVAFALDRVRLADEARQAAVRAKTEELRSALLSTVSHDLRTPLAAIMGAGTALRDDPALGAETRRDLIEAVCEEAERMDRLVSNLLEMTRLESGAMTPRCEWVPLVEVVGSALARVERRLAGHPVRTVLPDDLPLAWVDPVLLEHLLVNLLENAAKYTAPGTLVELRASRDAAGLAIEVADSGAGLPPGEEERIFERFYRGATPGPQGAGLGLAIARGIAEIHGGRLVAANQPGGGAVFRLTLPGRERPPEAPDASREEDA